MFTVKVREETLFVDRDESKSRREIQEVLYEALQVMLLNGDIVIDLKEENLKGETQVVYTPVRPRPPNYNGAIYVMNRYGSTVAKYLL